MEPLTSVEDALRRRAASGCGRAARGCSCGGGGWAAVVAACGTRWSSCSRLVMDGERRRDVGTWISGAFGFSWESCQQVTGFQYAKWGPQVEHEGKSE